MVLKTSLADILKTEQPFPIIGKNMFSCHFHRFLFCMRAVPYKPNYILVLNIHHGLDLLLKHPLIYRLVFGKLLDSNHLATREDALVDMATATFADFSIIGEIIRDVT